MHAPQQAVLQASQDACPFYTQLAMCGGLSSLLSESDKAS